MKDNFSQPTSKFDFEEEEKLVGNIKSQTQKKVRFLSFLLKVHERVVRISIIGYLRV